MRFYNKSVFPKEAVEGDEEIAKHIKENITRKIASAIADYMEFEEQDDCIHHPELQDEHGWVREYIGSVDISIPTKLMPMGDVYVCQNCFSYNNVPKAYSFYKPVPKYCECCGAHFTNIFQDSEANDGLYFIKHEEADDDHT